MLNGSTRKQNCSSHLFLDASYMNSVYATVNMASVFHYELKQNLSAWMTPYSFHSAHSVLFLTSPEGKGVVSRLTKATSEE